MRRALIRCGTGVTGAAAVVLLAACGGEESSPESSASDRPAESSAAETTAEPGQEDFCTQAAGIDERVDSALSGLGGDDPSVPGAFRQLADEFRAIDPPEEIAADWEAQAGGLDQVADALAGLDINDPESLATLDEIGGSLSTAGINVDNYLRDECGI